VATLRAARVAGLQTNIELMTTAASRLAALARPCLPHLDLVIVNDFEVGAIVERRTRRTDGATDVAAVSRAIDEVLACGPMRYVVAHFPEGALIGGRDGFRLALGSVAIPSSEIVGVNGAGDAFAAGMLYALHEDWQVEEAARLAHACAAASMRALSTTAGVIAVAECLALADKWGLRPAPG
jgi:sugar/nucleoside kinase (ribokinase family)